MRLSDLPPGRYQITLSCNGPCREIRVSDGELPGMKFSIPPDVEIEDAFNAGRFRCRKCRQPAGGLEVESIAELGSRRTSVLKLEGWRK